jgi:hypothetical protein
MVHQTDRCRLGTRDDVGGEVQLASLCSADQPRQEVGPTIVTRGPHLGKCGGDLGIGDGHAQIAGERE